jgi:hypothetical protein
MALLSGHFVHSIHDIGKAIFIAVASNNLLKAAYVFVLAAPGTRLMAGTTLLVLAGVTLAYGLWGFL